MKTELSIDFYTKHNIKCQLNSRAYKQIDERHYHMNGVMFLTSAHDNWISNHRNFLVGGFSQKFILKSQLSETHCCPLRRSVNVWCHQTLCMVHVPCRLHREQMLLLLVGVRTAGCLPGKPMKRYREISDSNDDTLWDPDMGLFQHYV